MTIQLSSRVWRLLETSQRAAVFKEQLHAMIEIRMPSFLGVLFLAGEVHPNAIITLGGA